MGAVALEVGVVVGPEVEGVTKFDRALTAVKDKTARELGEIAVALGQRLGDYDLEESGLVVIEADEPPITEITRRDVARCFGDGLSGEQNALDLVRRHFPIDTFAGAFFFGHSLAQDIERHVVLNPGDWPTEFLFEKLGALTCSRRRFGALIEASVHPLARRGDHQVQLVNDLNAVLRRDGYQLEVVGEESGYPIYHLSSIRRGVAGIPKNLIFASAGPKPEIGFRDAVNNDIVILSNAESCLVYDRPIRRDGLLWSELVEWWCAQGHGDGDQAAKSLGYRLRASLGSDAERSLFDNFFRIYRPKLNADLPALIPQVYLHYDPAIVSRLRRRASLPRQRMDFLLLLPGHIRVVIEVDGVHHFSRDDKPSLTTYAVMVAADRDLRLAGYEIYRFGANELVGEAALQTIEHFFNRLFELHRVAS
jgi:very-short-patch-repair endonuclease